ncbi:MAG: hypothetical protein M1840_005094 [Geoglossum simile]|nr:MAG: hypothetical protein M1840_005094 [Geoglossum simile]
MELPHHYISDLASGRILRPKQLQRLASGGAPKGCPDCRMPVRDIDRYNRIVKTALLDQATRRFVAHANMKFTELIEATQERETSIDDERKAFTQAWSQGTESKDQEQVNNSLKEYRSRGQTLLRRVRKFTNSVKSTEQPFGRVNSMVAAEARRQGKRNTFDFEESIIQTGVQFRAEGLSLRVHWAILWDFDTISSNRTVDSRIRQALREAITTLIQQLIQRCLSLKDTSRDASLPQHEVEARTYHALFSALQLNNYKAQGRPVDTGATTAMLQRERDSLDHAESLCSKHPGTLAHLKDDVAKARRLLDGGTFYSFVTTQEKREVYQAMARQFSGTGHWYYCRNYHPFTVGECGMPMEEARCPQCGEPVGGRDHNPVEGVRRAEDWEAELGGS